MSWATALGGGTPEPWLYAFTLGLVAAVNPCGLPLLPAYLSFFVGSDNRGRERRNLRGILCGTCVTVGFLLVFGLLGLLFEAGIDVVLSWVPWAMIPIGAAMAVLGLLAVLGKPIRPFLASPRWGSGQSVGRMVGFGVTYAIGSLTCALPLFLAAVASSFVRRGFAEGIWTFVAYALGMSLFLMVAGLVVANAGAPPLRRLAALSRAVPRLAGGVLCLVGCYLVLYWGSYAANPSAAPEPVASVEHLADVVTAWLSRSPTLVGIALAAIVVTVILAGAAGQRRRLSVREDLGAAKLPESGSVRARG
ncbi:MAG: cytochrome c biogenesis CcdA family protein [Acidimicrobiales bacterium]